MRSQRQLRVGEELRHILAGVFLRGDFHWPAGFTPPQSITVTEVQISPDLKNATVFIVPLNNFNMDGTVKNLNKMAGFFRHYVAQHIELRYAPMLSFKADETFTYAANIEKILHDPSVAKDLRPHDKDKN